MFKTIKTESSPRFNIKKYICYLARSPSLPDKRDNALVDQSL